MTSIEKRLAEELKKSMIEKNSNRTMVLRSIKSQLDLLNTSGFEINEEMQLKSLQKMAKQRMESAEIYKTNFRPELYEVEVRESKVIEEFLPKQMTQDEVEEFFKNYLKTENIDPNPKESGKYIGAISKALAGRANGKMISDVIKSIVST